MLELGVDEITLVLQLPPANRSILRTTEWNCVAETLISKFEDKSDIKAVFGKRAREPKAPAGYTMSYKYGEHNFYFAIAYHEYQRDMGIVIKFSAQSLDYYLEAKNMMVYEFLQMVSHKDYTQRLSRIDLTADFIDEDIDISNIYQNMMDSKIAVFRQQLNEKNGKMEYRRVPMKFKGIISGQDVQTMYVGSEKSKSRLRIYDKRVEQIKHKGNKLEKAMNCNAWIRFEGVFRDEYAHQLSEALMTIKSNYEFANLIALTLYQKYLFMEVNNGVAGSPTDFTQMLIDCVFNNNFKLRAPLTRSYELARNIEYICHGSGTMTSLHKIKCIWGMDAVREVFEILADRLEYKYIPNDDCIFWLMRNTDDYRKHYPDFQDFINENLSLLI